VTKPFIVFDLIAFNATDIVFLKFTSFLLVLSIFYHWGIKNFSPKLEVMYLLVIIFMMAKGALLFYASSIFIVLFYMIWIVEKRSVVKSDKVYYFLIIIFINIFLMLFSFLLSDNLFLKSFSFPYSLVIVFLLTLLMFFLIFVMNDIYKINLRTKCNTENVVISFVLFFVPFLFKYALLYIHNLNLLLQVNHYLYDLITLLFFIFSLLLFIKSLHQHGAQQSYFILYLLHILNFLGVAVVLYGERFSFVYIQMFFYLTLLQYVFLLMQQEVRLRGGMISYALVLFLFLVLPPAPIFHISIKYLTFNFYNWCSFVKGKFRYNQRTFLKSR